MSIRLLAPMVFLLSLIAFSAHAEVQSSADSRLAPGAQQLTAPSFGSIQSTIFSARCMDCHSANQGDGDGLDSANFDSYEETLKVVNPFHPETSRLYLAVASQKMPKGMDPMPGMPNPAKPASLSPGELQIIFEWIQNGAQR